MIENGGRYRQVQVPGKRSVCGYALGAPATLCGEARFAEGESGEPAELFTVSSSVWLAIADPDVVPRDYRPCRDCAAAYRAIPGTSNKNTMTERLPESVDRRGQTPRDAERDQRVSARLGRVVPLLHCDEDGALLIESLWTVGAATVHAGAERLGRVALICRDDVVNLGLAEHPQGAESLTCTTCRRLIYRGGRLSVRMWSVVNRPADDPNRFRPVGRWTGSGIGEVSPAPLNGRGRFARPALDGLVRDESGRASAVMVGAAGVDMPRASQAVRKVEANGRTLPLTGRAQEAMGACVRESDGTLWCPNGAYCTHGSKGFHNGWDYHRVTGRIPDYIHRTLSRREKEALRVGYKRFRRSERAKKDEMQRRERAKESAQAVAMYRKALRDGMDKCVSRPSLGMDTYVDGLGRMDAKPVITTKAALSSFRRELHG
jgi:hypothetical protein